MSELDEAWALALTEAEERARAAGRADLTDYLTLRNANDLMRKTGKDWLLDTFVNLALEANSAGAAIEVKREEHHRFKVGNAGLVGNSVRLAKGVRTLLVEVGWPRIPGDGFIRGGGLALANIRHFGIKSRDQALRLLLNPDGSPIWVIENTHGEHAAIHASDLRSHIAILLNLSRKRLPHT